MRELVPMKIKITLTNEGKAKYPLFNNMASVQASGLDWSKYVDIYGDGGWHYDKISGHKDDSLDSPLGQQWGMLILPEQFVLEAIAAFPGECGRLTELEAEAFYNEKVHVNDPDELIDNAILQSLKLKLDLNVALTPAQIAAIDPKDPTPGIIENKNKTWIGHKTITDITIKEAVK